MERETITYNGKDYHRYPESNRRQLRAYYWRHDKWKEPPFALHRQIWIDNFGEIPKGYVVHHKDGDTLNNSIENLECISRHDHCSGHMLSEERRQRSVENGKTQSERIVRQLKEWRENNPEKARETYAENGKRNSEKLIEAVTIQKAIRAEQESMKNNIAEILRVVNRHRMETEKGN